MMQSWFPDVKLSNFIHLGKYGVEGTAESSAIFSKERTCDSYMNQRYGFTATNYDPHTWADLYRRASARYSVLTTKHHDGMALWDTKVGNMSVVKQTPAMREAGRKVSLYFSHLDWSHPDYAPLPPESALKIISPCL